MKKKLLIYYLLFMLFGVTITGVVISKQAQHNYRVLVEERLKNISQMISSQLTEDISPDQPFDYDQFAKKKVQALNNNAQSPSNMLRVTFIDFNGVAKGDSEADIHTMENQSNRAEEADALQGKAGISVRKSQTLGGTSIYYTVPIRSHHIILRLSTPMSGIDDINRSIWTNTIIVIVAVLLLSTLLTLRFSTMATRPIEEITAFSREIMDGNFSKRLKVRTRDEFGQLTASFNEMSSKLEMTIAELTEKNIRVDSIIDSMTSGVIAVNQSQQILLINSIASEIFNIKHGPGVIGINIMELLKNHQITDLLKESIASNTALSHEISFATPASRFYRVNISPLKSRDSRELNTGAIAIIHDITNIKKLEQIRTEFVSNVTHELKTPLTSIRGFIETLRNGAAHDPAVADKFLEIIDIEAERLYMLINDILQLSEIESKQQDVNIATHDFGEIVEETFSILQGVAAKKNVTLSSVIQPKLKICANRDRIKQMLINLIENGIKYNKENGSVTVKAERYEGQIAVTVSDTGIGIAEEHLPRIFERFYRVDKGRSRSMGGTGLGLSIVKHIINLYSGDIKVSSELGKGSDFIIHLPV